MSESKEYKEFSLMVGGIEIKDCFKIDIEDVELFERSMSEGILTEQDLIESENKKVKNKNRDKVKKNFKDISYLKVVK